MTPPNPLPQSKRDSKSSKALSLCAVESRILRQLIEALLFEGEVSYNLNRGWFSFQIGRYNLNAYGRIAGFNRVRLEGDSIKFSDQYPPATPSVDEILGELPALKRTKSQLHEELKQTLKLCHWNAKNLHHRRDRRNLNYIELESTLSDGHPYHPCFKSRIEFSELDHSLYSPEAGYQFTLHWLGIKRSHVDLRLPATNDAKFWQQELGLKTWALLQEKLNAKGASWEHYTLLPLHPWQWQQLYRGPLKEPLTRGDIIDLNAGGDLYQASQSVRTLLNVSDPKKANIKLPMAMTMTSSQRTLRPEQIRAAPTISEWLQGIIANDPYLVSGKKLNILSEYAGISLRATTDKSHWSYRLSQQLGVIFRASLSLQLSNPFPQNAVPFMAISAIENDQRPFIQPWLLNFGVEAWVKQLLNVVIQPLWHLLVHHGVALEAHAQNMILIHDHGWPIQIYVRDFHESMEYVKEYLRAPHLEPNFAAIDSCYSSAAVNQYYWMKNPLALRELFTDTLFVFNLSELANLLHINFDFNERRFWSLAAQEITKYNYSNLTDSYRIAAIKIHQPNLTAESLLRKKLTVSSQTNFQHSIDNALYPLCSI